MQERTDAANGHDVRRLDQDLPGAGEPALRRLAQRWPQWWHRGFGGSGCRRVGDLRDEACRVWVTGSRDLLSVTHTARVLARVCSRAGPHRA